MQKTGQLTQIKQCFASNRRPTTHVVLVFFCVVKRFRIKIHLSLIHCLMPRGWQGTADMVKNTSTASLAHIMMEVVRAKFIQPINE